MRVWHRNLLVAGLVAVTVAGCGRFGFREREAWRSEAERQCLRAGVVKASPWIREGGSIHEPASCGMDKALHVAAFADGAIALDREIVLGCPMVAAAQAWIAEVVQPAATKYFGQRVVRLRAGGYSCRGRNGATNGPLSEHAFGNALDVSAFTFEDERTITVVRGWRGEAPEQNFLREIFVGACGRFSTVLGPGADAYHADHFHLDLAKRQSRRGEAVCRPVIKFEPTPAAQAILPAEDLPPAPISARAEPSFWQRLFPF